MSTPTHPLLRRRTALGLALVLPALTACQDEALPTGPVGACPARAATPSAGPSGGTASPSPAAVSVEAWRSGAHEAWSTDTGLSVPGCALDADYLAFFPGGPWWFPRDEDPWIAVQGVETTVVALGDELVGLRTADGARTWRTTLTPPDQGLVVAGVLDGLLWTSAGAVSAADGTVQEVPEALVRADDALVTGTLVVTVRSTGREADSPCEVTCLDTWTCAVRWTTEIGASASVSPLGEQVLVGGYHLLDLATGSDEGEIILAHTPPVDNAGAFEVAYATGDGLGLVVQDDGAAVTLSCYEGLPGPSPLKYTTYPDTWPDVLDAADLVWSQPLDLAPGAVVATAARGRDPVQEPDSDAFWVIDLTEEATVRVSRWEPGPS